jgi:transcriptional regulator with XRE-family HTH domain
MKPIKKLRTWMDDRDVSQTDLSDMLGISQAMTSRYLSGARALSIGKLLELSNLTGIPAEALSTNPRTTRILKLLSNRPNVAERTLKESADVA